ncbi:hypothetical protein IWQ61_004899 [Dispira simplex]|nr:hypothetical protein IWQ61_004899 [Dispira simplex]
MSRFKRKMKVAIRSVTSLLNLGPLQQGRKAIELHEATARTTVLTHHQRILEERIFKEQLRISEKSKEIKARRDRLNKLRQRWPEVQKASLSHDKANSEDNRTLMLRGFNSQKEIVWREVQRARWRLASELLFIFDLKLIHVRTSSLFLSHSGSHTAHIGDLIWPSPYEWHKFPTDYINSCIDHVIHGLRVLSKYLDVRLPFQVDKQAGLPVVCAGWTPVNHQWVPLFLTDDNVEQFIIGLAMLCYNVGYLCQLQQVPFPLNRVTQAARNLRAACDGILTNDVLTCPPVTTGLPYNLYQVVWECAKLYEQDPTTRTKVNPHLRRLHFCDNDVDYYERQDEEKWDVIDSEGRSMLVDNISPSG